LREVIEDVLTAYCRGISVRDISDLLGIQDEVVYEIIDTYNDLFLE